MDHLLKNEPLESEIDQDDNKADDGFTKVCKQKKKSIY